MIEERAEYIAYGARFPRQCFWRAYRRLLLLSRRDRRSPHRTFAATLCNRCDLQIREDGIKLHYRKNLLEMKTRKSAMFTMSRFRRPSINRGEIYYPPYCLIIAQYALGARILCNYRRHAPDVLSSCAPFSLSDIPTIPVLTSISNAP